MYQMCCITSKGNSYQLTSNQLSACKCPKMLNAFIRGWSTEQFRKKTNKSKLLKFDCVKYKSYLVYTKKAKAQRGQHLDDCRAAVVLDWVVGLQLRHYTLPAHMLPHEGTEVTHHKRTLLHLTTQENVTAALSTQVTSNFGKQFNR